MQRMQKKICKRKIWTQNKIIDVKARSAFKINKITMSMMKCAHGCNHCGERYLMMNKDITNQECPRFNEIEQWDHLIRCKNARHVRVEHVKDLTISLMKCKNRKVDAEEILSFVEDTLRFLENKEIEEHEKSNA